MTKKKRWKLVLVAVLVVAALFGIGAKQRMEQREWEQTALLIWRRSQLIGLSMGKLAELQGIELDELVEAAADYGHVKYYDEANRCWYWIAPEGGSLEMALCLGYSARVEDWFETASRLGALNEICAGDFRRKDADEPFHNVFREPDGGSWREYEVLLYQDMAGDENTSSGAAELVMINKTVAQMTGQSLAETKAAILEKAEMLGLTMGEVAEIQGFRLDELEILEKSEYSCLYYDRVNECNYGTKDPELPRGEQICYIYRQGLLTWFGDKSDRFVDEIQALFRGPLVPTSGSHLYEFRNTEDKHFYIYFGRGSRPIRPTDWVTIEGGW